MNKKMIIKMILLMIAGAIVGAGVTMGMYLVANEGALELFGNINGFFTANSLYIYIALLVLLFVPAVVTVTKGKNINKTLENESDEELDRKQILVDKYINAGLTVSQVFMILNFVVLGLTFNPDYRFVFLVLAMYMFNVVASSVLEMSTIKHIQKYDKRLKGDPTSLKFGKDFLESMDEAEKHLVYKSGYKAFQASRGAGMLSMIVLILIKFVFEVGDLAILFIGIMLIVQSVAYYYYSKKFTKSNVASVV